MNSAYFKNEGCVKGEEAVIKTMTGYRKVYYCGENIMINMGYPSYEKDKLDLDELKVLCEDADTDYAILTDSTGIYALASSHGIENGLFLPDNISLIELDPKVGEHDINDPSWRGGTPEDPDFFDPDDAESRKTVNYKVYYTMKQLKKSIATTVFKIELVDKPKGELHDYEIVNDTTKILFKYQLIDGKG